MKRVDLARVRFRTEFRRMRQLNWRLQVLAAPYPERLETSVMHDVDLLGTAAAAAFAERFHGDPLADRPSRAACVGGTHLDPPEVWETDGPESGPCVHWGCRHCGAHGSQWYGA